jgi:hypothetical protein
MEPEWLSYREVADRLGVTPEAARSRAKRLRWRRQTGNDGRALVLVALEPRPPGDHAVAARSPSGRKAVDPALVSALESYIKTLQGDIEALKEQLSAVGADLVAERARTEKAIEAFAALAERLDALAAERARPWWRRFAG